MVSALQPSMPATVAKGTAAVTYPILGVATATTYCKPYQHLLRSVTSLLSSFSLTNLQLEHGTIMQAASRYILN